MQSAMRKYGTQPDVKETLDQLQMNHQCCGSVNYSDWFAVQWVDAEYLQVQTGERYE